MTQPLNTLGFAQLKKNRKPNGIAFDGDGSRTLWLADQQIAGGVLPDKFDLYSYFYELRFLEDFPEIEQWTFGAAWTQKVMIEEPKTRQGELIGNAYFASEDDLGIYIIEQGHDPLMKFAPVVQTPLPKLFNQPLNIPLRIVIAQMVTKALDDELSYGEWYPVTSLLPHDDVAAVLTTDMVSTYGFQIKALGNNLRQALCDLQSISQGE